MAAAACKEMRITGCLPCDKVTGGFGELKRGCVLRNKVPVVYDRVPGNSTGPRVDHRVDEACGSAQVSAGRDGALRSDHGNDDRFEVSLHRSNRQEMYWDWRKTTEELERYLHLSWTLGMADSRRTRSLTLLAVMPRARSSQGK